MKIRYLIDGQDCNPVKRSDIYLEINHDQQAIIGQPAPHVGINNLYFSREDIARIMGILNTAPGITEGIPFDIVITEQNQTETINMYLDMMNGFKRSKHGLTCDIKMLQSLDWLDDIANSFTLESMYNEAHVPFILDGVYYYSYQDYFDRKVIFIPYVISLIPDYVGAYSALFSIIYIGSELYKIIKRLKQESAPSSGLGLTVSILSFIIELTFAILMIAALIVVIKQLIDCLIQPVKYHGAMLFIDMMKIISQKMGLEFNSSIWQTYPYNQIAYLPEKYNPIEDANPNVFSVFGVDINGFAKRGFTTPGYATGASHNSMTTTVQKGFFNGLGGDFLRVAKTFCNGKIIIPDQTNNLVMERRDYYPSDTPFQLPAIRQDWNGYNTDELTATIIIRFLSDFNDKNSMDKYLGTILQATTQQIRINDIKKVGLKGLREISILGSRGIRKETLTFIEKAISEIKNIWDTIWGAFVSIINDFIDVFNVFIDSLNFLISLWNLLMDVISEIIGAIEDIYNAISNLLSGNPINGNPTSALKLNKLSPVSYPHFENPFFQNFNDRIGCLLLENDIVNTPKILLVDIQRSEFTGAGGYSGHKRIAYVHPDNQNIINAQFLWDNFYFIDQFTDTYSNHNRYTKITPANNQPDEANPISIRLADFKGLVSNPKFKDNYGEDVIAESIQWYIEQNGKATLDFRKHGWLSDPQNINGPKRAEEININLTLQTSLPNGQ